MIGRAAAGAPQDQQPVRIASGTVELDGILTLPSAARAIVVFAHGSGSSRLSPRNRFVARSLHEAHLATLLMDLMTAPEEAADAATAHLRFNIPRLASRLVAATDWVLGEAATRGLCVGYFGASTGAAAALVAAGQRPAAVRAIVSRGGRPDLAVDILDAVLAPTLLIVGGQDREVLAMNRAALGAIRVEKDLAVVPGAGHLFEEPGALEEVARLATGWFVGHLTRQAP